MQLVDISEPIAKRRLDFTDLDGTGKQIEVAIGIPQPHPDFDCYYCPYQITGEGIKTIRYATGIDGIQALQLVMVVIGAELDSLNKKLALTLRWEGGGPGDFGFPR